MRALYIFHARQEPSSATEHDFDRNTRLEMMNHQEFDFNHNYSVPGTVFDIGGSQINSYHVTLLHRLFLNVNVGRKRVLPSALLHDDVGLQIWSQITHLPDYYQTRDEIDLLQYHGAQIAEKIPENCTLIDLGSGDNRKLKPLLDRLEDLKKPVRYFALDLSRTVLEGDLRQLAEGYEYVRCFGLWGSFDNGLAWSQHIATPKWFLSLGSILGNDFFEPAVERLRCWAESMGPQDRMLLGMDAHDDVKEIWTSYHDSEGLFEQFIRNGLEHSNKIFGRVWYRPDDWSVSGVFQDNPTMHYFAIRAKRDVMDEELGLKFLAGDEIACYEGFKYQPRTMREQFKSVGFEEQDTFKAPKAPIFEYLLSVHPRLHRQAEDFNSTLSRQMAY